MLVQDRQAEPGRCCKGADYLGMMLMALFLGCLEYTLEEGPRWDWFGDDMIRPTVWISGPSLASASSGAA
jgi:hypothetical protein